MESVGPASPLTCAARILVSGRVTGPGLCLMRYPRAIYLLSMPYVVYGVVV